MLVIVITFSSTNIDRHIQYVTCKKGYIALLYKYIMRCVFRTSSPCARSGWMASRMRCSHTRRGALNPSAARRIREDRAYIAIARAMLWAHRRRPSRVCISHIPPASRTSWRIDRKICAYRARWRSTSPYHEHAERKYFANPHKYDMFKSDGDDMPHACMHMPHLRQSICGRAEAATVL